ncbi:MAG: PH domain-containing protein [Gemmataceae bacterium]|nr:PH domain-containing protein [Gemmataceae bacterium]MDW8266865.1 PH domain-containing protein [Gemmataceae bacterium]
MASPTNPDSRPAGADDHQERDVWWDVYAGRDMLPSFLVCVLLTVAITAVASYLGLRQAEVRRFDYALTFFVWGAQLVRWLRRILIRNYRLTTRRLFRKHGYSNPAHSAILLTDIESVTVEQPWWQRRLGIGRLRIVLKDGERKSVVLPGVKRPHQVAELIRQAAAEAVERAAATG